MKSDGKASGIQPGRVSDLQEAIRRRAEEIYVRSGRLPGRDLENWAQAEAEVLQDRAAHPSRRQAVVIKVNGVQYVGEYSPESSDDYSPGEFQAGIPVVVRFDGEKMFVKRPNGKELETRIVRKIG